MLGYRIGSQLGHLPQHRPAATGLAPVPRHRDQGFQARHHRVGVGVVGIVDHGYPVISGADLHAAARDRPRPGERRRHLCEGGAAFQRHGGGGQRVAHVVLAVHRQLHGHRVLPGVQRETGPGQVVDAHLGRPDIGGMVHAGAYHAGGSLGRHRRHRGIIGVQHRHAATGKRLRQFPLRIGDGLPRPELTQMSGTDVENDPDRRRRDGSQFRDVARTPGRKLQHQELGGFRRPQHRPGMAELVVERPGRSHHLAERAEHGGDQILCRGLARRARDPDDP
ncbi:Uncharacterised protein [Mycobacteroides abscessus subsp. abscessus]|nr:Uncharacterised protein [Mycobacteroides abscessus subsp. abscessus]